DQYPRHAGRARSGHGAGSSALVVGRRPAAPGLAVHRGAGRRRRLRPVRRDDRAARPDPERAPGPAAPTHVAGRRFARLPARDRPARAGRAQPDDPWRPRLPRDRGHGHAGRGRPRGILRTARRVPPGPAGRGHDAARRRLHRPAIPDRRAGRHRRAGDQPGRPDAAGRAVGLGELHPRRPGVGPPGPGGALHPRRAVDWRPAAGADRPAHPAERDRPTDRPHHLRAHRNHPAGGLALLPRLRDPAAHRRLGADGQRGPRVPRQRLVAGGLPRRRDHAGRDLGEPGRRLAARRPGPDAEDM
ncbi:MAG: Dipeptide transport system permease protein DppC, partial [uncultured Thermomicrobiales bacterium]